MSIVPPPSGVCNKDYASVAGRVAPAPLAKDRDSSPLATVSSRQLAQGLDVGR